MLFKKKNIESKDVILTKNHSIKYDGVNNMNSIIISSVGTGKTRGFVKSNLLNKGCSFVVTDVKGDLVTEFHDFFENQQNQNMPKYNIKVINFKEPNKSIHYNPLWHLETEMDVFHFVTTLVHSRNPYEHDSFWNNATINIITGFILFIMDRFDKKELTFRNVLKIYDAMKNIYRDDPREVSNFVSCFFKESPRALKYVQYSFSGQEGRLQDSLFVTLGTMLAPFENEELLNMMETDEMVFSSIGTERTVLFIVLDDTNHSYDFLVTLLYDQIIHELYHKADSLNPPCLPEHVRFIMDDFTNYYIPNINSFLSTCRSRGISIEMILQSESQLSQLYGISANNLIANCTYVYMGNNDIITQKNVATRLGISTVQIQNMIDTTYIFFPEGKTIKDKKSDYTKHLNYPCLQKYQSYILPERKEVVIKKKKHDETYMEEMLSSLFQSSYENITVRKDLFDSNEEKLFYNTFKTVNTDNSYKVIIHPSLREIFDLQKIEDGQLKWKMLKMHCDFIFKKNGKIIAGLEIDGSQHLTDEKQKENDKIKDCIFEAAGLPLMRYKARSIREDAKTAALAIKIKLDRIVNDTTIDVQVMEYFSEQAEETELSIKEIESLLNGEIPEFIPPKPEDTPLTVTECEPGTKMDNLKPGTTIVQKKEDGKKSIFEIKDNEDENWIF